jgi:hypothetical protein
MSKIDLIMYVGLAWLSSLGCQAQGDGFQDVRIRPLDPLTAVKEADSVLIAAVVSVRDLREVSVKRGGVTDSVRLAEMDVTLAVLRVLKGPSLPTEIHFRFYDARGYDQLGPPQGLASPAGSRGVFFLTQWNGVFRSFVDVYRPEIETPWLRGAVEPLPCRSVPICLANILLSYPTSAAAPRSFSGHLVENVAIARQLVGFSATFDLLDSLVSNPGSSVVRQRGCIELAKWYPLEFPSSCRQWVTEDVIAADATRRTALREQLRMGGVAWVRQRIGSKDEEAVRHYLQLLARSSDAETRHLATTLLNELR